MRLGKLLFGLLVISPLCGVAQTTLQEISANPDKAGGVYYAYPTVEADNTPAPKGYKPFYVSHYGRHGSRFLISDNDYKRCLDLLEAAHDAGALTPEGEKFYSSLQEVWKEAEGRGGELTPLGYRQHRGIGRRLATNYPEVFRDTADVFARSTVVMRCAQSMNAFIEGLKEKAPNLEVPRESSQRHMDYLNYHSPQANRFTGSKGPAREICRKFEAEMTDPDRLMGVVFNDPGYVYKNVNPSDFMWSVYWITVDMQNMETPLRFNLLTDEELFNMWRSFNYNFYTNNCNNPMSNGMLLDCAKPLLSNIIECADDKIARGAHGADLRFGHDGNLIPLAALMRVEGAYGSESDPHKLHEVYADFKVSPMAGNIQLVFFRDKKNDVIVKALLNEKEVRLPLDTDMWPYYRWDDLKAFWQNIIDQPDYGAEK